MVDGDSAVDPTVTPMDEEATIIASRVDAEVRSRADTGSWEGPSQVEEVVTPFTDEGPVQNPDSVPADMRILSVQNHNVVYAAQSKGVDGKAAHEDDDAG